MMNLIKTENRALKEKKLNKPTLVKSPYLVFLGLRVKPAIADGLHLDNYANQNKHKNVRRVLNSLKIKINQKVN